MRAGEADQIRVYGLAPHAEIHIEDVGVSRHLAGDGSAATFAGPSGRPTPDAQKRPGR